MKILLLLAFALSLVDSGPLTESGDEKEYVEPEYLDHLLEEHRYEEFSRLLGISNPRLSMPRNASDINDPAAADPSFIKGLFEGDIILPSELEEVARQGIDFSNRRTSQWQGEVPYVISTNLTSADRGRIENVTRIWNATYPCLPYTPRTNQPDYVFMFRGVGCYSVLGKSRGQQPISLGAGCYRAGTIVHEMSHAIGVVHEQSRPDRDDFLDIIWDNIPQEWEPQYRKESSSVIGIQGGYDCTSVMHYPNRAPSSNKAAFQWKNDSCKNQSQVGQRNGQTEMDKMKIKKMYNCK